MAVSVCGISVCAYIGTWSLICDLVLYYNEIPMLPIACVCMWVCGALGYCESMAECLALS